MAGLPWRVFRVGIVVAGFSLKAANILFRGLSTGSFSTLAEYSEKLLKKVSGFRRSESLKEVSGCF